MTPDMSLGGGVVAADAAEPLDLAPWPWPWPRPLPRPLWGPEARLADSLEGVAPMDLLIRAWASMSKHLSNNFLHVRSGISNSLSLRVSDLQPVNMTARRKSSVFIELTSALISSCFRSDRKSEYFCPCCCFALLYCSLLTNSGFTLSISIWTAEMICSVEVKEW